MKKHLANLAAATCMGLATFAASAQVTFTFQATDTQLELGDSATVSFFVNGLGSQVLSAYDLNFTWAQGVVSFDSRSFAPGLTQLGAGATLVEDSPVAGNFGVQAFSVLSDAALAATQPDSFLLGTFTVTGLAEGSTTFSLGSNLDFERNFVGLDFASLGVDVGSVTITVGAIPEPSTYALMLLGLGCIGALSRRRGSAG